MLWKTGQTGRGIGRWIKLIPSGFNNYKSMNYFYRPKHCYHWPIISFILFFGISLDYKTVFETDRSNPAVREAIMVCR